MIRLFFAFILSFLFTFYLVPLIIKLARRFNILDRPDGRVKMHEKPVAYLGGIAVYVGFIISLGLVVPFNNTFFLLVIGATLLLFLGLIDDLIRLQHYQKFVGQCIAALCFLKSGIYLKEQFFVHNPWFNVPLSLLWVLTCINAFNLVDVMDGLATTIASSATCGFMLIALLLGQHDVALFLCAFLGAQLAFLWYNWPSAKIYLGDAGALFIGGVLGAVPFLINWGTYSKIGFFAPPFILAIPLLEVAFLISIRTYKNIPFYNPSPDHFCIYLQQQGYSKPKILFLTNCLALLLIFQAYLLCFLPLFALPFFILQGNILIFVIYKIYYKKLKYTYR